MNDSAWAIVLILTFTAWVILMIYSLVRGGLKHRFIYTAKKLINGNRPLAHLLWGLYVMICGVSLFPAIVEWTKSDIFTPSRFTGHLVINFGIPMFWLFSVAVIAIWVINAGGKPILKYNEKESEWKSEEDNEWEKFKLKLPKLLQRVLRK